MASYYSTGRHRMDAAIDAMRPMGFSKQLVVAKMTELLKEYGGNDGWKFIEADAYKVLIESILADEEEARKQGQTTLKDDSLVGDHAPLATGQPSGENAQPRVSQTPNIATQNVDRRGDSWHFLHNPPSPPPLNAGSSSAQQQRASTPPRTRPKPRHGWISDGEDDDEFVILTPAKGLYFG